MHRSSAVDELFAGGKIADAILALMMLELLVLLWLRSRLGSGPSPAELLTGLGAGAALLLALRASLKGSDWRAIAVWLVIALMAHVADLMLRWNRTRAASSN